MAGFPSKLVSVTRTVSFRKECSVYHDYGLPQEKIRWLAQLPLDEFGIRISYLSILEGRRGCTLGVIELRHPSNWSCSSVNEGMPTIALLRQTARVHFFFFREIACYGHVNIQTLKCLSQTRTRHARMHTKYWHDFALDFEAISPTPSHNSRP